MSVRPERECDPRKRRTRALLQTAPLYKLRHSKLRHSKLRHSKLRPCGCSGRDRSHLGGSRAANRVGPCVGTLLALVLEPCRPLCWNLADPCVGTLPILVLEPCRPLCWNLVGPSVGSLCAVNGFGANCTTVPSLLRSASAPRPATSYYAGIPAGTNMALGIWSKIFHATELTRREEGVRIGEGEGRRYEGK